MGKESDREPRAEFERLYEVYRNRVHAYCARRTNRSEAADAVSETFLVVWRRLDEVPAEPLTLPFLYGVAAKVLANQHRSSRRRRRLGEKLVALGVTPTTDPVMVAVRSDEHTVVERAIRGLKAKDRELVMLDVWEELPRAQIADMMNMNRAAVDQRLHRAYRRLQTVLQARLAETSPTPPITAEGGAP